MKKIFCLLFTWILLLSVPCCTEQKTENETILAKINDYPYNDTYKPFFLTFGARSAILRNTL